MTSGSFTLWEGRKPRGLTPVIQSHRIHQGAEKINRGQLPVQSAESSATRLRTATSTGPTVPTCPSVQLLLPVRRHRASGARGRLVQRMVPGFSQLRPIVGLLGSEVPEPVLARLKTLHKLVAGPQVMPACMLRR